MRLAGRQIFVLSKNGQRKTLVSATGSSIIEMF